MTDWILNTSNRCDAGRCPAQAYVLATYPHGRIYLCAHHYAMYETKIRAHATQIVDERAQLDAVKRLDVSA